MHETFEVKFMVEKQPQDNDKITSLTTFTEKGCFANILSPKIAACQELH